MYRVLVALPLVAVLVAAAWPSVQGAQAAAPGLCEQMTTARLLENPGLASEYAQALKSGDAGEIARVRAMFDQIRSAHGCAARDAAQPQATPAPRLPPGHPPITSFDRPTGTAQFEGPGVVTI